MKAHPRVLLPALLLAGILAPAGHAEAASVFALVDTGELYVSDDQGTTWSVRAALPTPDAAALIAATSPQRLLMAGRSGTVYRSLDAGMTWAAMGALTATDVVDLAGRADGALLALTGTGTVYLSTDQGASFTALGALTASNQVSLALGPDDNVYALTRTGEVTRSTDDGATWSVIAALPVPDAVTLRTMGTSLFVLTGTGLTYRSTDLGATWTPVGTASQVGMRGLTPAGSQLVAVTREGLTARSVDGSSWTWVGSVNQVHVVAVANDTPQATGVPETPPITPKLILAAPRPNPLPAGTALALRVSVPENARIGLELYDLRGRRVAARPEETVAGGTEQDLFWDPGVRASGVYFLRVVGSPGIAGVRRIVLLD